LTAHDLEGVEVAAQLMLGLVGGRPQDEERKAVPIEPADGRLDVGTPAFLAASGSILLSAPEALLLTFCQRSG
jgi:hypothetical protein